MFPVKFISALCDAKLIKGQFLLDLCRLLLFVEISNCIKNLTSMQLKNLSELVKLFDLSYIFLYSSGLDMMEGILTKVVSISVFLVFYHAFLYSGVCFHYVVFLSFCSFLYSGVCSWWSDRWSPPPFESASIALTHFAFFS